VEILKGKAHNKSLLGTANSMPPQSLPLGRENMNKTEITTMSEFILEIESLAQKTTYAEDRPIYEKLLAQSAKLIAKLINKQPIGDDIASMERLFGNTWFKDTTSYSKAYGAWDRFKELFSRSIHGMTVNERLFNLGLLNEFDAAVAKKDKARLRAVLFKCFLDEENIQAIIVSEIK